MALLRTEPVGFHHDVAHLNVMDHHGGPRRLRRPPRGPREQRLGRDAHRRTSRAVPSSKPAPRPETVSKPGWSRLGMVVCPLKNTRRAFVGGLCSHLACSVLPLPVAGVEATPDIAAPWVGMWKGGRGGGTNRGTSNVPPCPPPSRTSPPISLLTQTFSSEKDVLGRCGEAWPVCAIRTSPGRGAFASVAGEK